MSGLRLLGAVLAGGAGRRFGGPKAEAPVAGVSMVRRAAAALRPWVEEVIVVSSRPLDDPPGRVVPDRVAAKGPLGGLDAALAEACRLGLDGVFLLACDLPLVRPEVVGRVVAALGSASSAAPRRPPDGVEPLCAVYRVGVAGQVEARLDQEDLAMHRLFREAGGVAVDLDDLGPESAQTFLNVNTPSDRDRAEAELSEEGS